MDINLKALGLEKQWPGLARLQAEIAGLEQRSGQADVNTQQLQAQLVLAREQDLGASAKAVRADKKPPAAKCEVEVQRKLDQASRERDVLARALESARSDYGTFLQEHRSELYHDVAVQRQGLAASIAASARAALVDFSQHEDLHYVLKELQPPVAPVESSEPAQRLTQVVIGLQTTRSSGPARGDVEAMLSYLIGLAASQASPGEGNSDAA
jgi:hypothetical protein